MEIRPSDFWWRGIRSSFALTQIARTTPFEFRLRSTTTSTLRHVTTCHPTCYQVMSGSGGLGVRDRGWGGGGVPHDNDTYMTPQWGPGLKCGRIQGEIVCSTQYSQHFSDSGLTHSICKDHGNQVGLPEHLFHLVNSSLPPPHHQWSNIQQVVFALCQRTMPRRRQHVNSALNVQSVTPWQEGYQFSTLLWRSGLRSSHSVLRRGARRRGHLWYILWWQRQHLHQL